MKQRGRPRHPDVLTPRQWEVLALLRQGLSNEQIALRLGISLDGVKFHVSEILGKLGVTSRNEAARWHEERERIAPSASLRHGAWRLDSRQTRFDSPQRRKVRGGSRNSNVEGRSSEAGGLRTRTMIRASYHGRATLRSHS